jgi:single-strand DNA-binding protein
MAAVAQAEVEHSNEVHLVGRLAADPVSRELPSGDLVVTFRLVVTRDRARRGPSARAPSARAATVDTIDCAAWTKGAQRSVRAWTPGDVVEVQGALRRRFWRSPHGPSSRSEVEVSSARRAARATSG